MVVDSFAFWILHVFSQEEIQSPSRSAFCNMVMAFMRFFSLTIFSPLLWSTLTGVCFTVAYWLNVGSSVWSFANIVWQSPAVVARSSSGSQDSLTFVENNAFSEPFDVLMHGLIVCVVTNSQGSTQASPVIVLSHFFCLNNANPHRNRPGQQSPLPEITKRTMQIYRSIKCYRSKVTLKKWLCCNYT